MGDAWACSVHDRYAVQRGAGVLSVALNVSKRLLQGDFADSKPEPAAEEPSKQQEAPKVAAAPKTAPPPPPKAAPPPPPRAATPPPPKMAPPQPSKVTASCPPFS